MRCPISPLQFNARYLAPGDSRFPSCATTWARSAAYALLASLIFATWASASASAYGAEQPGGLSAPAQGSSSRKAVIDVRTSPGVYLPGPTFRIEVYSSMPVTPRVLETLQQGIEQTLVKNDPRLKAAAIGADTSIACIITDLAVSPGVETRTRPEYRKTGETTITDPQTGVSRTEDVYGYIAVPYRALVFEGRMSVKCEVTDGATGILLYSDRFDAVYTDAREAGVGSSAPSVEDLNTVYLKLAENAVGLIRAQLCPRVYSEIVALSSGKLKEASKLMEAGLWSEALTLLSNTPAFKNPKDDAYRFYSIGVAHEALAYKAFDYLDRKSRLERAVENYRRAAELKPNEDMFWAPKNRAEFALWQTSGLTAQIEVFDEAKKLASKATTARDPVGNGATDLFRQTRSRMQTGPVPMDNQTVVQWVKSGRSTDYITASIKHASSTRFDLSASEVLKLRRDGVNNSVLKAMAEAQQGRRPDTGARAKAVFTVVSLLWWLPFLIGR